MSARAALNDAALVGRSRLASKFTLITLSACAAILFFYSVRPARLPGYSEASQFELPNEETLDQSLYQAATSVLGSRDGTIIVMDPQTGRIRAIVNPNLTSETAFAPGSTIKPFTLLAALRTGIIQKNSLILCREHYSHEGFATTCSHPQDLPPFNPTEAIAYSCNYFFGKVGEQLDGSAFNSTLTDFGFGESAGIHRLERARASAGRLPKDWLPQNALGEGSQIQVTPIQLLTAYSALVNGGYLFEPHVGQARYFVPKFRRNIYVDSEQRALIIEGMRGAVRYGTAEGAGLYPLPTYTFGKTGTSTETGGFRTQGWFVGFASQSADPNQLPAEPESVRLAVLIFLKRAHGAEAAALARPIFEAYVEGRRGEGETRRPEEGEKGRRWDGGTLRVGEWETGRLGDGESERRGEGEIAAKQPVSLLFSPSPSHPLPPSYLPAQEVRVHLVRENETRTMPIENYVLGVVAAEGSTEDELDALKALAVASRTYAWKNLRRHADEGFDFCTTTHCQRFRPNDPAKPNTQTSQMILSAVRETEGEILQDDEGRLVDSYFSASCGGARANIHTLWGTPAPTYLRGGRDEYCRSQPHHSWTDVISSEDLLRALQSDQRTNVGEQLSRLSISRRDTTGRAELIAIEGKHRRSVSGWDFKIIVGRVLGWNLLKSSRFEITRSGSNYVFRGSGFGHGLGLCQEGAHVMAERGASYREILMKYFPGTRVRRDGEIGRPGDTRSATRPDGETGMPAVSSPTGSPAQALSRRCFADLMWAGKSKTADYSSQIQARGSPGKLKAARRTLSSEHFQLDYPANIDQRDAHSILSLLEVNRSDLIRRVSSTNIQVQFPAIEIFVNDTTGDFVSRTGQPPWAAAATRGSRVELQPLDLLKRRRILETTLRHELVHTLVDAIGHGRTPRWLAEGLALHVAGEGPQLSRIKPANYASVTDLDRRLSLPMEAREMRASYTAAYREVSRLIAAEGERAVWQRVLQSKN